MPRPARRRGGDGAAAGVSSDKVSVPAMVDARGDAMAVAACRGEMGVADDNANVKTTNRTNASRHSR